MTNTNTLSPEDFKKELDSGECFLIDIRTDQEVETYGEIPGTKARYDMYKPDFANTMLKLPKEQKYLLYCWHGTRTDYARELMKQGGFSRVKDLAGGIEAWKFGTQKPHNQ